jgi:hypothetical protein
MTEHDEVMEYLEKNEGLIQDGVITVKETDLPVWKKSEAMRRRIFTLQNQRRAKHGFPKRRRKSGSWWKTEDKIKAVASYCITGSLARTAEFTGIEYSTLRRWKTEPWWNETVKRVIVEKDEELDRKMTQVIDTAVNEINDRLVEGDFIYDMKLGKVVRTPAKLKDLTGVAAMSIDKRTALREKVKTRQVQDSMDERLAKIAASMEALTNQTRGRVVRTVIAEAEVIEEKKNETVED